MRILITKECALNSNLILLILGGQGYDPLPRSFKFQSDSINTDQQFIFPEKFFHFKFQSDSINTSLLCMSLLLLQTSLNSNLILLILIMCLLAHSSLICFKFQSDSINTPELFVPVSFLSALNSNLILLIP